MACFDSSKTQAFYMLQGSDEFAALADCKIVAQDTCVTLPVHTHILALHSRVLCSAFAAHKEVCGRRRPIRRPVLAVLDA